MEEKPIRQIPSEKRISNLSDSKHKKKKAKKNEEAIPESDIAVIGMSCRFPGAGNYDEFWKVLQEGRYCIDEIPTDRWDKEEYYSKNKEDKNKGVSKWGGFIKDIDKFDAPLFRISPREAELMDPQQRIMLELTWSCMEDAGYSPSEMSGDTCGVYVGSCNYDYEELILRSMPTIEGHISTGIHVCLIPNRISYVFNLKGPSISVDTACSSALVALNDAVRALQRGDCKTAFVGAVSLLFSPTHFVSFSKTGMLSPEGMCKTFDADAKGYVRSEGAGIILLKPLRQALSDHDNIHGIIKGIAVNHGGKVSTLTSPNSFAQSQVVIDAVNDAAISPQSISYIEAHGTGTPKGDPIEINGLKRAFARLQKNHDCVLPASSCGIGSVKTNIGHMEGAAGLGGVIKVLLSMKYRKLPALLHYKNKNPRINLENSPFYIVSETQKWNGFGNGKLRAGVSSFGFGGVNAHVILEECSLSELEENTTNIRNENDKLLFILSAQNKERLKCYAGVIVDNLTSILSTRNDEHENKSLLESYLYTLQTRQSMEERIAFEIESVSELIEKLHKYIINDDFNGCLKGRVRLNKNNASNSSEDNQQRLKDALKNNDVNELAKLWLSGDEVINWSDYYTNTSRGRLPKKIRIPNYPFAKKRYWISKPKHFNANNIDVFRDYKSKNSSFNLHPLLHRNNSNLYKQNFSSRFNGDEYIFNDHVVNGQKILPAAAYLEISQLATIFSLGKWNDDSQINVKLSNIVWSKPIIAGNSSIDIQVDLYFDSNSREEMPRIKYNISSETLENSATDKIPNVKKVIHNQGVAQIINKDNSSSINIDNILERFEWIKYEQNELYDEFNKIGFNYGSYYRALENIKISKNDFELREVIGKIRLTNGITKKFDNYLVQPSLLDAAIQSVMGLMLTDKAFGKSSKKHSTFLPFSLKSYEFVYHKSSLDVADGLFWVWVRRTSANNSSECKSGSGRVGQGNINKTITVDIDILDENSKPVVAMHGFSFRDVYNKNVSDLTVNSRPSVVLMAPVWKDSEIINYQKSMCCENYDDHRLILAGFSKQNGIDIRDYTGKLLIEYTSRHDNNISIYDLDKMVSERSGTVIKGAQFNEYYDIYACVLFEEIKKLFLSRRKRKQKNKKILVQVVIPDTDNTQIFMALSGLLSTARLENPEFVGQLIFVENFNAIDKLERVVWHGLNNPDQIIIRNKYNEMCEYRAFDEITFQNNKLHSQYSTAIWKENGNYLITGGAGALGRLFTNEIQCKVNKANIFLMGRTDIQPTQLEELRTNYSNEINIEYISLDICNRYEVEKYINRVVDKYGTLNGIIHAAGVHNDNFVVKKSSEEFMETISPKVKGLLNLDAVTKDQRLDFFVCFSSVTGVLGNVGQIDYAAANAFMDAYSIARNRMTPNSNKEKYNRHGVTVSLNWPLWEEGGMKVNDASAHRLSTKLGMIPMATNIGLESFYHALDLRTAQILVMEGVPDKIRENFTPKEHNDNRAKIEKKIEIDVNLDKNNNKLQGTTMTTSLPTDSHINISEMNELSGGNSNFKDNERLIELEKLLTGLVSEVLQISPSEIDTEIELSDYGFDSITITDFTNRLEEQHGIDVNPAMMFDLSNIDDVAKYILETQAVESQESISSACTHNNLPNNQLEDNTINEVSFNKLNTDKFSEKHDDSIVSHVESYIKRMSSSILNIDNDEIDIEIQLSEYGFDSITFTELTNEINEVLGTDLAPTVFFDNTTIRNISKYLYEYYNSQIIKWVGIRNTSQPIRNITNELKGVSTNSKYVTNNDVYLPENLQRDTQSSIEHIAVIGMSGTFPKSNNIDDFWQNLKSGRCCISEIPPNRWNWQDIFGDPKDDPTKSDVKWGGFIDSIEEFDSLFFGISPKEAMSMDPQQRLIMINVWHAIEDAGYAPSSLSGTSTGIFVGTANLGYDNRVSKSEMFNLGIPATSNVPSVGPNRMSYHLNLHGPSEPIETACSSSLIAIHRAVTAIQNGDCDQAIVGGVNTIVAPDYHLSFNRAGMLSKDGRCKTFSKDADGYVRGEGAGMIFLKKITQAEADGDHIYGVIRSTATNHGGRANSFTSPNAKSQSELLIKAYKKADIDPRTVTYIETHGTGTSLGDPIEVNGIKRAFSKLCELRDDDSIQDYQCSLGSVKSNIGHLELAAGIAGVVKVLLQFKHKLIVPSINCEEINPYIDLKNTHFKIARNAAEWKSLTDSEGNDIPLRAGVSSFGFGGANSHVVLEEYNVDKHPNNIEDVNDSVPVMFPISAKSEDSLNRYVELLIDYLDDKNNSDISLVNLAYTFQVGRDAMDQRIAVIASSKDELRKKLTKYIEGRTDITDVYVGDYSNSTAFQKFYNDEDIMSAIEVWLKKRKYSSFLTVWVNGLEYDWNRIYTNKFTDICKPKRISAPTYPFERKRFWVDPNNEITTGKQLTENHSRHENPLQTESDEELLETLEALKRGRLSIEDAINSISQ